MDHSIAVAAARVGISEDRLHGLIWTMKVETISKAVQRGFVKI